MKKIPSLFIREFDNENNVRKCLNKITPGCEWVFEEDCLATEKLDGTCCLIQDDKIYKRYDAKNGKQPPKGAIPCQPEPDPITTHWPHWVLCDENNPSDKYHIQAFKVFQELTERYKPLTDIDGTYELVGKHFQSNPYNQEEDYLFKHGNRIICKKFTSYQDIKDYLKDTYIEGIVFYRDNGEMCKVKRTDFNFEWNNSTNKRR